MTHGGLLMLTARATRGGKTRTRPGEFVGDMRPSERAELVELLEGPPPADWWVKVVCS